MVNVYKIGIRYRNLCYIGTIYRQYLPLSLLLLRYLEYINSNCGSKSLHYFKYVESKHKKGTNIKKIIILEISVDYTSSQENI